MKNSLSISIFGTPIYLVWSPIVGDRYQTAAHHTFLTLSSANWPTPIGCNEYGFFIRIDGHELT